jgi:signal transduction histidine kinase
LPAAAARMLLPKWLSVADWWPRLSLASQFALASSGVVLVGMLVLSTYVSSKIEESVKHDAGVTAALFVDSFIAPYVIGHSMSIPLGAERVDAIERVINRRAVKARVASVKIWGPSGIVLYGSNKDIIGRHFAISEELAAALNGNIAIEFDELDGAHGQSAWEEESGVPLIEVYAPVRDESGTVVAVAEFYENAERLRRDLQVARWEGWTVTSLVSAGMVLGLFWIVARGSRTIERQREDMAKRVKQNDELRGHVERASRRATEENERFIRRIGADLHDGPAQLISLALLRLDNLEACCGATDPMYTDDLDLIRGTLHDAMTDVRNLCAGLSMPEVETVNLRVALAATIRYHERRTKTSVTSDLELLPLDLAGHLKICVCRFVQEGLSNAFRHASGKDQRVMARMEIASIVVEVQDGGPGLIERGAGDKLRLGLTGMWDRIESLGGRLEVVSRPGEGTLLRARLPIGHGGEYGSDQGRSV